MEVSAVQDIPSHNDFLFENYFWSVLAPASVGYYSTEVLNQNLPNDPKTGYACTIYSAVHAVNEANSIEAKENNIPYNPSNPVPLWKEALTLWAKIDYGWSLQWACKLMRDKNLISIYTRCENLESVKQALIQKKMIHTWSSTIDWEKTAQNSFIAQKWPGYAHAFTLVGFDDGKEWLICKNSFWENYGVKGYFYVKYDDFKLLFSCYAYTDKDDTKIIKYEQARKDGIWNGQKPNEIVSRVEVALIAQRLGKTVKLEGIWNWKDWHNQATRLEIAIMMFRAHVAPEDKDPWVWFMTRGELILKYYNWKKD